MLAKHQILSPYFTQKNIRVTNFFVVDVCLNSGPRHWQNPFWAMPRPRSFFWFLMVMELWYQGPNFVTPLSTLSK
jgi:hypothetical protein